MPKIPENPSGSVNVVGFVLPGVLCPLMKESLKNYGFSIGFLHVEEDEDRAKNRLLLGVKQMA